MWVLVFIYFYDMTPYAEPVTSHTSMIECFQAREALADEVGRGAGYFKPGQQAICINLGEESN
jgi:hypothetical protein